MKRYLIFVIIALIITVIAFIGGILYADKTSGIPPSDSYIHVDGYFSNIRLSERQKSGDTDEYPYLTYENGMQRNIAKDLRENPQDYSTYEADVYLYNNSNFDLKSIWALYPKTEMYYDGGVRIKELESTSRNIWIRAFLNEWVTVACKGETIGTVEIIIKTKGLTEEEIKKQLESLQINLQIGVCEKSLNPEYDISRNIWFDLPIYYKN